jgi:hypothetical protein
MRGIRVPCALCLMSALLPLCIISIPLDAWRLFCLKTGVEEAQLFLVL